MPNITLEELFAIEAEARRIGAEKTQDRWIPVTERLPELSSSGDWSVDVLVLFVNRQHDLANQCVGYYDYTDERIGGGLWYDSLSGDSELHDVTHWRPLPALPEA